jgi:hypothetical protein
MGKKNNPGCNCCGIACAFCGPAKSPSLLHLADGLGNTVALGPGAVIGAQTRWAGTFGYAATVWPSGTGSTCPTSGSPAAGVVTVSYQFLCASSGFALSLSAPACQGPGFTFVFVAGALGTSTLVLPGTRTSQSCGPLHAVFTLSGLGAPWTAIFPGGTATLTVTP